MAVIFRPALFTRPAAKPVHGSWFRGSALLTTLAVAAAAAPFVPESFDNPTVKRAGTYDVGRNATLYMPVAVAAAPFAPVDLQNPVLRPAQRAPDQQSVNTLLLSAAPASNYAWPNPITPRASVTGWVAGTPLGHTLPTTPPLKQTDWPIPVIAKVGRTQFESSALSVLQLIPGPPPFRQTEHPNPIPIKPARQAWEYSALNVLSLQVAAQDTLPIRQTDWANPALRRPSGQDWNYSALSVLDLPPAVMVRHAVFSQPWKKKAGQDWIASTPKVLDLQPAAAPFRPGDNANPLPQRTRTFGYAYSGTIGLPAAAADTMPIRLTVWPIPVIAKPIRITFDSSALPVLSLVSVPPFRQADWANPAARPIRGMDWNYSALQVLGIPAATAPVTAKDYPNPILRKWQPSSDTTGSLELSTLLRAPDALPKSQYDWPNPVLRTSAHAAHARLVEYQYIFTAAAPAQRGLLVLDTILTMPTLVSTLETRPALAGDTMAEPLS